MLSGFGVQKIAVHHGADHNTGLLQVVYNCNNSQLNWIRHYDVYKGAVFPVKGVKTAWPKVLAVTTV